MTLAHEIGHSFGAWHDQDTEDCSQMVTRCQEKTYLKTKICVQGGNYIMSSNGTSQQNLAFSPCSMQEIESKMASWDGNGSNRVARPPRTRTGTGGTSARSVLGCTSARRDEIARERIARGR